MKAKELAELLLKHPDMEVSVIFEDVELGQKEFIVNSENIHVSEYQADVLYICEDESMVKSMRAGEDNYVDIMTRPYKKGCE